MNYTRVEYVSEKKGSKLAEGLEEFRRLKKELKEFREYATPGLVSALQLVDATPSEMFATIRKDTSGLEMQHVTYPQYMENW